MTETDEGLLTAAKLREQLAGDLAGGPDAARLAPLAADERSRSIASFLDDLDGDLGDLGTLVEKDVVESATRRALATGDDRLLSHLVGVTETDVSGSQARFLTALLSHLRNFDAPAFATLTGNPNMGKTNTLMLLVELVDLDLDDDLLVLSNVDSWARSDLTVTSSYELATTLLEHRDCPKAVVIDEASTHLDARTFSREVSNQYTPLAKRYAKIGVHLEGVVCHTGKDLHPERKRLTTLAVEKERPDTAEFFEEWPADSDEPEGQLFGGSVDSIEEIDGYDVDDAAMWDWNLPGEVFAEAVGWDELLAELRARGPT